MDDDLSFYSSPGPMTDAGLSAGPLDNLPSDVGGLCRVVQGTTLHIFWAERYGQALSKARIDEVQLRMLQRRLTRMREIDPRPLPVARPPDKRIVGNCRDFTLLLVAMFRHQGVPARARCGFARYFLPDHFEDHWVAEYWNGEQRRWILVDSQLDELQREALEIDFDPLDVPRDQFVVGGEAWLTCRRGEADPDRFGIFDMRGLAFVRGDLVRDVAAFNKVEMLPWDCWGIIEKESLGDPDDLELLDRLAELTIGETPRAAAVRSIYQSEPRLRVEAVVHSYVDGRRMTVAL